MNKPKIFITRPIPLEVENFLSQYCDYKKWDSDEQIPKEELIKNIGDIEALLTAGIKIDDEFLSHSPKLRVVSNISVGYDNFDINAMKNRNIIGTNTPFVLTETVSDLVMALILSSARRICEMDRYVKSGKWKKEISNDLFGIDIHHATLGLVGVGRIGESVAQKAKLGFNMNVLYYDINRKTEIEKNLGIQYSTMENLLKESDFVAIMVPLNKHTYHLIDNKEFELMKESAIFINTSRGQTVNETALVEALENKKIRGAGLDVYEEEPTSFDNPLLKMSNVVTVPHIGSATSKTRFDMDMLAAQNLVKAIQGQTPPNVIPELRK
jgi:gluconate 2-dehydrogenase